MVTYEAVKARDAPTGTQPSVNHEDTADAGKTTDTPPDDGATPAVQ